MVQPAGRVQRLEALYAELPHVACQQKCRECCGPVIQAGALSPLEFERLAGIPPSPVDPKDFMACSMLNGETGLCRVYDLRPMICRLWGVTENMRCPYGCEPDRWLTEAEGREYLKRAEAIGGEMNQGPEGAAMFARRTLGHMLKWFGPG